MLPSVLDHVEIKSDAASFVLGGIDVAHAGLDAGALKITNKGKRNALLIARSSEDFERQRPSGRGMQQLGALELVAGGFKECESAAEHRTVLS